MVRGHRPCDALGASIRARAAKLAPSSRTGEIVILAYQGEPGAYSEAAALTRPMPTRCRARRSTTCSTRSASTRHARHRAVENSIRGTIHRNYDLLVEHEIPITGEVEIEVVHCLQALPGTKIEDVKTVYSHPQALAQCERISRNSASPWRRSTIPPAARSWWRNSN